MLNFSKAFRDRRLSHGKCGNGFTWHKFIGDFLDITLDTTVNPASHSLVCLHTGATRSRVACRLGMLPEILVRPQSLCWSFRLRAGKKSGVKDKKTLLLGAGLLLVSCLPALAWSSGGHVVIAAEAYRELSPELQAKVAEVLKAHPDYGKLAGNFRPETPGLDLGLFLFLKASTWPDEIRRQQEQYDHPHWHYIDYPLIPASFPMKPGPLPTDDALYGIAQSERALADKDTSPELRAVYLSYLIHLIGDLHQPLHCASVFDEKFPQGDKGGNDFYVKPNSKGIKLHSLWDGLLGTSSKLRTHLDYAMEIDSRYPRNSIKELKKHKTPKEWSLESRAVAIEKVYLRGKLAGSTRADTAPDLPSGYTQAAKAVAERQAALAGYRLADDIRKFLSE